MATCTSQFTKGDLQAPNDLTIDEGVFMATRSKRRVRTPQGPCLGWMSTEAKRMKRCEDSSQLLLAACRTGDGEAIAKLAKNGVDMNATIDAELTDEQHNVVVTRRLVEASSCEERSWLPLAVASYAGHVEAIEALVGCGAKASSSASHSALVLASYAGRADAVSCLLRHGQYHIDAGEPTALKAACYEDRVECARVLLAAGADPNVAQPERRTPLMVAARRNAAKMVALLLDAGAEVEASDRDGNHPLHLACIHGAAEAAALLLSVGARLDVRTADGNLPLHLATTFNHLRVMQLLLTPPETSADSLDEYLDGERSARQRRQRRRCLAKRRRKNNEPARADDVYQNGVSLLYGACDDGSVDTAQLLLDAGADVDRVAPGGYSPLYISAHRGNLTCVRLLISRGASLNVQTGYGETPLFVAARFGHLAVVDLLLATGSLINCTATPKGDQDHRVHLGGSPLHVACFKGHLAVVMRLLRHRADLRRAVNDPGSGPLYILASTGFLQAQDLNYAKIHDKTALHDQTPLDLAKANGHANIVAFLTQYAQLCY